MMNRRRFLTLTTCAAGVLLLPLESVWPALPTSIPDDREAQRPRMLYGAAGRDCARYRGAAAMADVSGWPDLQF
ncbi:MAG: twin-arginine translocation signal domain-containing protein [candidate division Zixibacteria bacterium]|nr:twin-arginine translocation signal domain-containing protein [candidate division Zixibacteria bacterium]